MSKEASNSYKKLKLHQLEENKRYKFYTIDNMILMYFIIN